MPDWPTTLPQYLLEDGFFESLQDQTLETQMDTGPAKIRRRSTTANRVIEAQIAMTEAQVAIFETFYLTTCAAGAIAFTWVHPRTRAAKSMRFRSPAPRYRKRGEVVTVQLKLEVF